MPWPPPVAPSKPRVLAKLERELETAAMVYTIDGAVPDLASSRETVLNNTEYAVAKAVINARAAGHDDEVTELLQEAANHPAFTGEDGGEWLDFLERMSVDPEPVDDRARAAFNAMAGATTSSSGAGGPTGDQRSLLAGLAWVAVALVLVWGAKRVLFGDGSVEVGKCYHEIRVLVGTFDEVDCDHPRAAKLFAVGPDADRSGACPNTPATLILIGDGDDEIYCLGAPFLGP